VRASKWVRQTYMRSESKEMFTFHSPKATFLVMPAGLTDLTSFGLTGLSMSTYGATRKRVNYAWQA